MGLLFKKLKVTEDFKVTVNNREIELFDYDEEEKLYDSYIIDIELIKKEEEIPEEPLQEAEPVIAETPAPVKIEEKKPEPSTPQLKDIYVTVNMTPVRLFGKAEYVFVDILDHYPFNTSSMQGTRLVCKRNGMEADFFTKIMDGDALELYWSN